MKAPVSAELLHAHARRKSHHVGESGGIASVGIALVDYGSGFRDVLGNLRRARRCNYDRLMDSRELQCDFPHLGRARTQVDAVQKEIRETGSLGAQQVIAFRQTFEAIDARGIAGSGIAGGARSGEHSDGRSWHRLTLRVLHRSGKGRVGLHCARYHDTDQDEKKEREFHAFEMPFHSGEHEWRQQASTKREANSGDDRKCRWA